MEGNVLNGPAEPVRPYVIVVGNEKGGTGKSTTAMHLAVSLNYRGLKAAGIDYMIHMYDGANHAFHNDTSAARYHEEAAQLAWQRTIAFFKEKLKT